MVNCADIDPVRVADLKRGKMPFFEPGLEELVKRNQEAGRLVFTTSSEEGMAEADFVFIAVDTPPGQEGEADMTSFRRAARGLSGHLSHHAVIVNRSTVPIGTGD